MIGVGSFNGSFMRHFISIVFSYSSDLSHKRVKDEVMRQSMSMSRT